MNEVWNCITQNNDPRYTLAAVSVCGLGCFLTIRLLVRAQQSSIIQRLNWLFLSAILGGTTIWTTHFVAMLGYNPQGVVGLEPYLTALSFLIAIGATFAGFAISAYGGRSLLIEAGGFLVGMGVATMHYAGMAAYFVQGRLVSNPSYVTASILLAGLLGMIALNYISRPRNRFSKYVAMVVMALAIATAHYVGMGALTHEFDPTSVMPTNYLSPALTGGAAVIIIVLLLAFGVSTYAIDAQSTRQAVERYRYLSMHDPLTGLANRSAFRDHLQTRLAKRNNASDNVALLSFDLNRFKEVNDVHGHAAGDAVLRTVAMRMGGVLRADEFLARIGGDEFVAVTNCRRSDEECRDFAERLLTEILRPIEWNGHLLSVGASIGIAVRDDNAIDIDTLISRSDVAMYRAKTGLDGPVCFYQKSMDEVSRERSALAMSMRSGLARGEFELYYQQQNDTLTGNILGFEALLRWHHPERGMVSPVEFIPIAEKTGFIVTLGEWVLRQACLEAVSWKNPLDIAINVAPQQLAAKDFPQTVQDILNETGIDPRRVELEITETGIIANHKHALLTVLKLKALGVRIAMDDYGTGYSSLTTLQSFPFDKIKIDKAFVDGIACSTQSQAIIRSTLILADSLNIPVLAEGVETQAHVEFLRREGCLQVQGFYYGKPGPVDTIEAIVNGPAHEAEGIAHLSRKAVVRG